MVAPVVIAAGVLARYGAKKLMKHLTKQTLKKSKGKAAINKAQKTKKNIETRNNMDVEKASWKKVYRGAREMDGSYTDPANAILRAKGKVNIGLRPIGKNANKVKKRDGFVAGEKAARKYVKEMDTRVKKAGLKKLAKKGYSLKDLEF